MKKRILVIGMCVLMLLVVSSSGCLEEPSGDGEGGKETTPGGQGGTSGEAETKPFGHIKVIVKNSYPTGYQITQAWVDFGDTTSGYRNEDISNEIHNYGDVWVGEDTYYYGTYTIYVSYTLYDYVVTEQMYQGEEQGTATVSASQPDHTIYFNLGD